MDSLSSNTPLEVAEEKWMLGVYSLEVFNSVSK